MSGFDRFAPQVDTAMTQASVIGAMLIDDRCVPQVLSTVSEEDFASAYRTIFRAIKWLFDEGCSIDPIIVLGQLGSGDEYRDLVMQCMEVCPTAANAGDHARILREQNRVQRLRELGQELLAVPDLVQARKLLEDAAAMAADTDNRRICTMSQAMQEFAERHTGEVHYLDWPIRELVEPLGAEKGDFIVVGGRPSTGKTALTIQCAYHWAKTHRVGYFSLETNRHKVADRLVSHAVRISKNRIRRNQMTDEDWSRWAQVSGEQITKTGLEVVEAAGMSVSQIQALATMRGYEIIVVDYLQLIEEPGRSSYESVTVISKKLHTLAQMRGITVVALSQLSRMDKSNPRHASMSDLRESGQIEQDADIILMLNPVDPKKPVQEQNRLLRVEKNKEGQLCEIELEFAGHLQTFRKAPVTLDERMGRTQEPPAPAAPPWQPSAEDYEYVGQF